MKKLSIIIPVYNKEKYIKKCLDSLVTKLDDSIEVILIDDGSTDNSPQIYSKYEKNITIIKQKNHGVSYARNVGINKAIGKYIMFVDSDDYLDDEWKNILNEEISKDYDLIYFSEKYKNIKNDSNKFIEYTLNLSHNEYHFSNPTSKLYNLNYLRKNNILFDVNIKNGEDMLFNLKCLLNKPRVRIVDKSFYEYIINETSVIRNFNEREIESDLLFQKKLKEVLLSKDSIDIKSNIYISNLAINGISYLLGKIANAFIYKEYKNISNMIDFEYYFGIIEYSKIISFKKKLVYVLKKYNFNLLLYIILKNKRKKSKNEIVKI